MGESLREAANLAGAALVLGQFVGRQPLSWWMFGIGALLWALLMGVGVALLSGDE
jgi:hypothetical protein